MERRTALVTGGNRGIGLEVCRQLGQLGLRVILGARDAALGERAATELRGRGSEARFATLDVASDASVAACAAELSAARIHVDVLVNNAGVYPQGDVLSGPLEAFREAMDVNFFGALRTCRAFVPAMVRAGYGRVVSVSSGYGSFGEGLEGPPAYCVSKAAMNALTVKLSAECTGDVKVNACCPGWVRTRMGGGQADVSVEEGARGIVWLATLAAEGPTGGFFRDRERIPW